MDLTRHVEELRQQLLVVAQSGGEQTREVAAVLAASLDSASRLVLLDALSVATEEITRELAPGSVEVRLRGRDPEFVVSLPTSDSPTDGPSAHTVDSHTVGSPGAGSQDARESTALPTDTDDGGTSRITLRLPEHLKVQIEELAGRDGVSVNSWIVRTLAASVGSSERSQPPPRRNPSGGQRFTGWAR